MKALIFAAMIAASLSLTWSAHASTILAPVELDPGATLSLIPNGFSSGDGTSSTEPYDNTQTYTFDDGLSVKLRARVLDYSDRPSPDHPGLYFDYEIRVLGGSIDSFSVEGWSRSDTFVKVCGIAGCGGSGANGIAANSISRSSDGSKLTWGFDGFTAGRHSANLQVFSSAGSFVDPSAFFTDGSGNTFSVETVAPFVAAVPLPKSAPLFGAALLALAGVGYGTKRMRAATSV